MKSSILAARTQAAIDRIATETARLGGEFTPPSGRMPDVAHRQLALLEAVAAALVGIEAPAPRPKSLRQKKRSMNKDWSGDRGPGAAAEESAAKVSADKTVRKK